MSYQDKELAEPIYEMSRSRKAGISFFCFFKNSKRICSVLGLGLLLSFQSLFGQKTDSLKLIQKDYSKIQPRFPAKESIERFTRDRDFQYSNDPEPPANPLAKWVSSLWRRFNALFTRESYENFWQYVFLIGALCLVLFILYKAKVLDYVFPSREKREASDYVIGQENIHEISFDTAIEDALDVSDYRLAIRLQYLKTLKMLSSADLIDWKPNRTNYSYVNELEKYPYQSDFAQITDYFEYTWYGDFKVDEVGYKEMKTFSEAFYGKLDQLTHV